MRVVVLLASFAGCSALNETSLLQQGIDVEKSGRRRHYCTAASQRCWPGCYSRSRGCYGGCKYKSNELNRDNPTKTGKTYCGCDCREVGGGRLWPSPAMTQCAVEGGFCHFDKVKTIRYASPNRPDYYIDRIHLPFDVGGVKCNNENFGDPHFGYTKKCFILAKDPVITYYDGQKCTPCWCDTYLGSWGKYEDCGSQKIDNRGRLIRFGGEKGFRCLRSGTTGKLHLRGLTPKQYRSRHGPSSCPNEVELALGSDVCVKFPFGNDLVVKETGIGMTKAEKENARKSNGFLSKVLGWFGEFQFCNQPASKSSFLQISTAPAGGWSVSGRLMWGCEMGILAWPRDKSCKMTGGMISFCKDLLGMSKKVEKFKAGKKKAFEFIEISGRICGTVRLNGNSEGGVDFGVGVDLSASLGVLGLFGIGGSAFGEVVISTAPNRPIPRLIVQVRFEGYVEVIGWTWKVSVWLKPDPETGRMEWEFHTPKKHAKARDHGVGSLLGGGGR